MLFILFCMTEVCYIYGWDDEKRAPAFGANAHNTSAYNRCPLGWILCFLKSYLSRKLRNSTKSSLKMSERVYPKCVQITATMKSTSADRTTPVMAKALR